MKDKQLSWEEAVLQLKQQPEQAELVRACFFDDPLLAAALRYASSTEWRAVQALLPVPHGKALDVGAGRGISAFALARDGWSTTALEPDSSAVVGAASIRNLAAEADLNIEVVEQWGEELPFADDSFDLVHCRQVLHHARNLDLLCREIGRVLKPGGIFIATREHVISRKGDLERFQANHPLHDLYGGEYAYRLREYLAAISGGGIKVTKVLNPYESDINLFPETVADLKQRVAATLHFPVALLTAPMLAWMGAMSRAPGRLYTFVGKKV